MEKYSNVIKILKWKSTQEEIIWNRICHESEFVQCTMRMHAKLHNCIIKQITSYVFFFREKEILNFYMSSLQALFEISAIFLEFFIFFISGRLPCASFSLFPKQWKPCFAASLRNEENKEVCISNATQLSPKTNIFKQKKNEKWKTFKKEEEGNNVYFQSAHLSPGTEYSQQFSEKNRKMFF